MPSESQIQALLTVRGKTGTNQIDYTLVDRSDGQGAQIGSWNTATLGALPTPAELAAITPGQMTAADTAQVRARAQIDVDQFSIATRAIVLALIDQLNVIRAALSPAKPAITPAQALQAIRDKAGTL